MFLQAPRRLFTNLWHHYEDDHPVPALILTLALAVGVFGFLGIIASVTHIFILEIVVFSWLVFMAGFIIARLLTLAWQVFIREQNEVFDRLRD